MSKKLTRSYDDRWLAGVLSGLAKYFNTNPIYFRIAYILFTVITGIFPGVIVYIVLWAIIPPDPAHPGIAGLFNAFSELTSTSQKTRNSRGRRQLTDVEEKDIKKNGRS
ncbi:PspC domain-containing protein [Limosilactobacillus fastidiosus]|uniref:PspC domain-containing protein n=1 Tax=Limosilactobacillus fastidiosus TaxID=2759855 RepID=A0A7W3TZE6_9LACO|nr:PspC domain-containing protein [Limosilactobacillus fastidiosus]MBB1063236.1 PspC domain-containing protein [Limosilactobacillus fastidiosus]MBB1086123.1 PspC domain-containing protein [Limosilactobacillus fastidiosus]MCD7084467.1 PspC domain-containing protein [Limosilactobacillus fastidiosus]MCD7085038.1 PspC domain-containing protein [Limosilactobacillus fastidiosus]MCD7114550.1 PspC domain-containing protein [Limosilactobacillus fastidiosus]